MTTGNLAEQIDKVMRDHLAQVRAEAAAAIERAFASSRHEGPQDNEAVEYPKTGQASRPGVRR